MSLVLIEEKNQHILLNLAQAYEAEFSPLTGKVPTKEGSFKLDTQPIYPYTGYILYQKETPVGFAIINIQSKPYDVAEFYIVPSFRHKKLGEKLAHTLFKTYPGSWKVRQIQGADHSVAFWRKVISKFTNNHYKESKVDDPQWGEVTMQTFVSP